MIYFDNYMKYTNTRRSYAMVGFTTLLVFFFAGINSLIKFYG